MADITIFCPDIHFQILGSTLLFDDFNGGVPLRYISKKAEFAGGSPDHLFSFISQRSQEFIIDLDKATFLQCTYGFKNRTGLKRF